LGASRRGRLSKSHIEFIGWPLVNYEELLAEVGPRYEAVANVQELARQAEICEHALDRLSAALLPSIPIWRSS